MEYTVHVYPVVRVPVEVEADSQLEAIKQAREMDWYRGVHGPGMEYADQIDSFLVDEEGDEEHMQSRHYEATVLDDGESKVTLKEGTLKITVTEAALKVLGEQHQVTLRYGKDLAQCDKCMVWMAQEEIGYRDQLPYVRTECRGCHEHDWRCED